MSCAYSREVLALYVEGDLNTASAGDARQHLLKCVECAAFCEQLEKSQSLLKSLRGTAATCAALTEVRREVMSRVDNVQETLGWAIRLERFLLFGFRRWRYAGLGVAALAVFAIVTSSVDGYRPPLQSVAAAVFEKPDALVRPEGYREWVSVKGSGESKNVYINPAAYRTFTETGRFPEGTMMVLETPVLLQVSVKDSRFSGGWGYFGFSTETKGTARLDEGSCRTCHETRAETDHVFTQFYPALKLRRG